MLTIRCEAAEARGFAMLGAMVALGDGDDIFCRMRGGEL